MLLMLSLVKRRLIAIDGRSDGGRGGRMGVVIDLKHIWVGR